MRRGPRSCSAQILVLSIVQWLWLGMYIDIVPQVTPSFLGVGVSGQWLAVWIAFATCRTVQPLCSTSRSRNPPRCIALLDSPWETPQRGCWLSKPNVSCPPLESARLALRGGHSSGSICMPTHTRPRSDSFRQRCERCYRARYVDMEKMLSICHNAV